MATETKRAPAAKAPAKKTAQAARKTSEAAKKTSKAAAETRAQAERTALTLLTDGAYAVVGVGDTAVGALRKLPERFERVRKEIPKGIESRVKDVETRVKTVWTDTPEELKTRLSSARKSAEKEFGAYAQRGRSVVRSMTTSAPAKRAAEQTKVARTQVKAATTSVRKAVDESAEAVETAAEKIGEDRA